MPPVIGLTGGLASGKSLVARILAESGAEIIDSDILSKELVAQDPSIKNKIYSRWPQVFNSEGILNRKELATVIFSDEKERRILNSILHPPIIAQIKELLAELHSGPCVIVIPLLIEENLFYLVDEVWLVWCRKDQQIERLMRRDNLAIEEANLRLNAQIPLDEKLKYAKVVISNDDTIEETRVQVEIAWKRLKPNNLVL